MDNETLILVVATFFVLIVIGIVAVALSEIYSKKHPNKPVTEEDIWKDETDTLPDADFAQATLVKKTVDYTCEGLRTFSSQVHFLLTFSVGDETVTYPVEKQVFDVFEEGQTGWLVTANGHFVDFGEGHPST